MTGTKKKGQISEENGIVPPLLKYSALQGGLSECYSEELWNFDEAVGMGTRQCQWLWHEGKNNWSAD